MVAGVSLLRVQTGCHKGECIYVFLGNWQEILFGIYYSNFKRKILNLCPGPLPPPSILTQLCLTFT